MQTKRFKDLPQGSEHGVKERTYHTMVSPFQILELLGVVLAKQCHVYIDSHS